MFDSIINSVKEKYDLGDKAEALVSALVGLMTDGKSNGFAGFIERFRAAGLGDLADSWISSGANTPVSNEQLESALGEDTLRGISEKAGTDYATTVGASGYIIPHVIDDLTPDGEMPGDKDLLSRVGGYLTGVGTSSGGVGTSSGGIGTSSGGVGTSSGDVAQAFDRVDASQTSSAHLADGVSGIVSGSDDNNSPLAWLLPLLLLGLLVILGFWFCGKKSEPVATVNTSVNKANMNAANTVSNANATAKTVDSSFKIEAKDGKYTVSGVVPDQATLDKVKAALTAQYGADNVDFSGLKVDANAKPFAADWWTNFEKMLPNLKDWKTGTLAFAGNAITAASGLPQAAMDQLKALFSGWTMSGVNTETSATENRTLTEVSLPNGTKLQAYPGGIEDQLVKFIESAEYKNGTADTLKDKWFNFDDLNFKYNSSELETSSKRQLDNIVAVLKAFPDVKIKIGAYSDKKGDDAYNKKLSDDRAKSVKSTLEKAGVGAQVPEAEGYGEERATVAETASDEERKADRKTSVRLIK